MVTTEGMLLASHEYSPGGQLNTLQGTGQSPIPKNGPSPKVIHSGGCPLSSVSSLAAGPGVVFFPGVQLLCRTALLGGGARRTQNGDSQVCAFTHS